MARVFISLGETENAKQALLHEVSEAFMGDLASPLKRAFPLFKEIEEQLIKKTFSCYNLEYPMSHDVHILDKQIVTYEAIAHMPNQTFWLDTRSKKEYVSNDIFTNTSVVELEAWSEEKSFYEFMNVAKELKLID